MTLAKPDGHKKARIKAGWAAADAEPFQARGTGAPELTHSAMFSALMAVL